MNIKQFIINYEKILIDINYQNKTQEKKLNNKYDILERKLISKKKKMILI